MRLEFNHLDPIFFLDLSFIFLFVLTLSYLLIRLLDLKKQRQIMQDVLSYSSALACVWEISHKSSSLTNSPLKFCSHALMTALNLDQFENIPLPFHNLVKLSHPSTRALFEKKLLALIHQAQNFSCEIMLESQQLIHFQGIVNGKLRTLYGSDVTDEKKKEAFRLSELNSLMDRIASYEHTLNCLPIAVWKRDKDGQINYCNDAYAGALESTPEEVVAECREIIGRNKRGNAYHLALKAITTQEIQVERCHAVVQGYRRWLEIGEVPLQGRLGTVGYSIDLTELENLEKDFDRHIKAHHEILQYLSTPIVVFSGNTKLSFFNQAFVKLYDLEESWLYTKPTLSELIDELRKHRKLPEVSNFPEFKKSRAKLFQTLLQPILETAHLPDGRVLRMMIAPYPMGGLIYLYDDITDRLILEQSHNTLLAVQKETLDHLYEGIAVFGGDFRLRLFNPSLVKLWDIDPQKEIIGMHLFEIIENLHSYFPEEFTLESLKQKLTDLFSGRVAQADHFVRTDQMVMKYSYVPLPDGSHLISFVDISDSWRFEQALQDRNKALEQSENLRTEFLSHVSYELRSPLNSVIGFSEILLNQYFGSLNERQQEYCRSIFESSQHLMLLINDVMDLVAIESKQFSLSKTSINLNQFIRSTLSLIYSRAYDQGLDINVEIKAEVEKFVGDERRLKQSLFHLLNNALKYTPAGGRINFVVDLQHDHKKDHLVFTVEDSGVGLEKGKLKEIQTLLKGKRRTQKVGSSGLGLPLVKKFIDMHEGIFSIDASPNKGLTAICSIPFIKEQIFDEEHNQI